ncbi:hypothetical protein [Nitratireductor sp. OM-1]|uniref:hypothetical protein n=1 Tax=Nitratireductor sp. OM-1 TaxID=1756988 RepID=UPI000DDE489C|nr:hypothetical protein [Nitratireductor sp. OM-1]
MADGGLVHFHALAPQEFFVDLAGADGDVSALSVVSTDGMSSALSFVEPSTELSDMMKHMVSEMNKMALDLKGIGKSLKDAVDDLKNQK